MAAQVEEGSLQTSSGPGSVPAATPAAAPAHASPDATGRAWLAVGLAIVGTVALAALFLVATRNSNGLPSATPNAGTAQLAPAAQPAAAATPVTVSLSEFKVSMPATLAAGQVNLSIRNDGTVAHELLVFKSTLDVRQYPQASGGIDEEGAGITKESDGDNLNPGTTQARTVDLSTPGTYVFVCNLPGHFAAGMYTTVVVK